jgi:hypothetical protein
MALVWLCSSEVISFSFCMACERGLVYLPEELSFFTVPSRIAPLHTHRSYLGVQTEPEECLGCFYMQWHTQEFCSGRGGGFKFS